MNTYFYGYLSEIVDPARILFDEPMSRHTTFRVGGPARYFVIPDSLEEVSQIVRYCSLIDKNFYVLGNGSNLLVSDRGYEGVIIQMDHNLDNICIDGNKIIAGAGARLARIAGDAMNAGLTGAEFSAGIPGTIGGAVVMNAGAYGGEMSQIVTRVKVVDRTGCVMTLSLEELEFGYRTSIFKKKPLVCLEVEMLLQKGDQAEIKHRMSEMRDKRISRQPLEYPSAGSTFKRPADNFAGKLIMDAGLSGLCIGGAKVSEKHCGFIINTGNAVAADIWDLIFEVQEKVQERFGVKLEPEVCFLGEF